MKPIGRELVEGVASDGAESAHLANDTANSAKRGTSEDEKDMYRMNKVRSIKMCTCNAATDCCNRYKNCSATFTSCPFLGTASF